MAVAIAFTVVFWYPLYVGGGLVGSDIYTYYLPQKAFYQDRLRAGEFPLWNNRVGHGYPLVGESQTGAFYPLHLVFYYLLDLNSAYNVELILHYILAFVGTWIYARRLRIPPVSAVLAALVYVYGWFPARVCNEWSIIGGAWFPLALWCAESFLQTRFWRYPILLTLALGTQMLAGHFQLAFLTQLTLAIYIPLRLWFTVGHVFSVPVETQSRRAGTCGWLAVSIAASFLLAAVQLVPTLELRSRSQRATEGNHFDLGQGHIPVWYWSQLVMPWFWYGEDVDLNRALAPGASKTNHVEAHLYFGLVPLALVVVAIWRWRMLQDRMLQLWLIVGVAALLYTPGWLIPVTRHIPGFSFFEGPGRFGVITTFAMGILAARGLEEWLKRRAPKSGVVCIVPVMLLTTIDLWYVSRLETDAFLVDNPPIKYLPESPVRAKLLGYQRSTSLPHRGGGPGRGGEPDSTPLPSSAAPQTSPIEGEAESVARAIRPVRLFCRGANVPTLLGVSSTPVYLGFGPAAYFDPAQKIPEPIPYDTPPTPEQIDWLRKNGVTHVLSFTPLNANAWPAQLIWEGDDPFLNRAWSRYHEPDPRLFLYELSGAPGRVYWQNAAAAGTAPVVSDRANQVAVEADSSGAGTLILADLDYPDWNVSVNGTRRTPAYTSGNSLQRTVSIDAAGQHSIVWTYQPRSVYWGGAVSALTLFVMLAIGHVRYWHPQWWSRRRRDS